MSDSSLFLSYIAKVAKENLAKLLVLVVSALMILFFIKWAITGGFGLIFDTIFGADKDEVIHEQQAAITQLENAGKSADKAIATLQGSNEIVQQVLQNHYEGREKTIQEYTDVIQKGEKAYLEAIQASQKKSVRGSQPRVAKKPSKAPDATSVAASTPEPNSSSEDPLADPHSPESLKLAQSQFDMVHGAYCLASPGACGS